jgi:malonyl-CoA O-methyltransferase
VTALEPRHAYRLWAPTYANETAISFLDEELAQALMPPLEGKRLLDAGCGIARRLKGLPTKSSVGVDASIDMLAAGEASNVAVADIRELPFALESFDVVWCRLVLGHLSDLRAAYSEFARVCRADGHLFVTDFHPDATAAGHRRRFRDANGLVHEVEHHDHDIARHAAMAERAGFVLVGQTNGVIGESVKGFYARAGRTQAYERDKGLAVVAAFLFRRLPRCAS